MTREEAIEIIRNEYKCVDRDCDIERNCGKCDLMMPNKESILEAYKMAIQALSQEPCDDAISRDFQIGDEVRIIGSDPIYDDCDVGWVIRNASEKVKTMYVMRNDGSADEEAKAEWYRTGRHNAMLAEAIKALPSVTQKSGKWIPVSERLPEEYGEYLITWKNPKYPKTYIGICECEITDTYDCEHHRFKVEWLFDGHITTAYPDSYVIAWMPLPKPYEPQERSE